MKNYFDLKGQVALVTGCSSGLGVQMAKALANQGCNIVAVARRQNLIEEVAKEIADEYGVETMACRCDITDTENVDAVVDAVLEKFGRIDIVINNAGTGAVAPAEDITDPQFENEMQIDLFGKLHGVSSVFSSGVPETEISIRFRSHALISAQSPSPNTISGVNHATTAKNMAKWTAKTRIVAKR